MLALERTEGWRKTRAVFLVSTPVEPGDPFDEWYAAGDQRHWTVPCSHCGAWWTPTWEHVVPGPPAALVCPSCGVEHTDGPDRVALLDAGQWRPTDRSGRSRGCLKLPHAALVLSPASTLAAIVADHAARNPEALDSGVDADLTAALPCEPDARPARRRTHTGAARGCRELGLPRIAFTVAATDVQSNRLETLILGMPADSVVGRGARLPRDPRHDRPRRRCGRRYRAIWDDAGVRLGAD